MKARMAATAAAAGIALMLTIGAARAATPEEARQACRNVATMARSIMDARQRNAPKEEVLKVADDMPAESRPLVRNIVDDAYVQPRQDTDEARRKAATEFETDYYTICFDSLTK